MKKIPIIVEYLTYFSVYSGRAEESLYLSFNFPCFAYKFIKLFTIPKEYINRNYYRDSFIYKPLTNQLVHQYYLNNRIKSSFPCDLYTIYLNAKLNNEKSILVDVIKDFSLNNRESLLELRKLFFVDSIVDHGIPEFFNISKKIIDILRLDYEQ